jgi:hypothetical protein
MFLVLIGWFCGFTTHLHFQICAFFETGNSRYIQTSHFLLTREIYVFTVHTVRCINFSNYSRYWIIIDGQSKSVKVTNAWGRKILVKSFLVLFFTYSVDCKLNYPLNNSDGKKVHRYPQNECLSLISHIWVETHLCSFCFFVWLYLHCRWRSDYQ